MSSSDALVHDTAVDATDAAGIFRIWPGDGVPPGSAGGTQREATMQAPWTETPARMCRNVTVPTLTLFEPAPGTANGTAMVIAPGGAFHFLMMDHEGYDTARWLAARGVTAFVLKYRLAQTPDADADMLAFRNDLGERLKASRRGPHPHPNPLTDEARLWGEDDGRQAIRFVRQHAADWAIDPTRIGIIGFSAGGAVALGPVFEHDAQSRPDFAAPIYPAPRPDGVVPADAPPLFLVIADDDASVPPVATAELYTAWHKAGKSAELHVFANGAHGFGMRRDGTLSDAWLDLFGAWLTARGLLGG